MKKYLLRLLPWIIVIALIAAFVFFIGIPLFSEETTVSLEKPEILYYEGGKKKLTMENEFLSFELDPTNTHFKVTDKISGAEWLSNPENADKDPIAVSANKEALQSTAIISYASTDGMLDMNNYKNSILNGNYAVSQQEDGSIRVDYSIGKIERVYCIPTAITKERYDQFYGAMSKKNQKKVSTNYTLIDPAKLDKREDKDELIAMYPSITEQAIYILKSTTSENNKKNIEGYFAEVNYTQEEYEIDQQLIAGKKESTDPVFNVTYIYRLEGADLVVEVPYSEIRYRAEYPITYLTLLPMFGAAGTDDQGYLLIPEGGGSLINFNNGKTQQTTYYANVYGWDYATRRKELINENRATYPVFGMAKNGSSFLCLMEGATSFGGIQADISGKLNSYNNIFAKYNVLHADQYNVSAKTAKLVFMFEKDIPKDSIVHRYRFFNTDSYVDMANGYGDYLRERYPEMAEAKASEVSPVFLPDPSSQLAHA